jgi:hypothetical protein
MGVFQMQKFARVKCIHTTDRDDTPLYFDVMIEGNRIVDGLPWLGVGNGFNGDSFPFILTQEGRLNFGMAFADSGAAEYSTDLRDREIEPGVRFNITRSGMDYIYEVCEVSEL